MRAEQRSGERLSLSGSGGRAGGNHSDAEAEGQEDWQ